MANDPMPESQRVRSPCVNICALDEADVCTGCQRSAGEISQWSRMTNEERRKVLLSCGERARASGMMFAVERV